MMTTISYSSPFKEIGDGEDRVIEAKTTKVSERTLFLFFTSHVDYSLSAQFLFPVFAANDQLKIAIFFTNTDTKMVLCM
jgi:hypothetical protein